MRENYTRRIVAVLRMAVITTAVLGLVVMANPADAREQRPAGTTTTARWAGSINTYSKSAVNTAYWSQYASKLWQPIGWLGGSLLGCLAGLTPAQSDNATLTSLNYVRSLAGLAPVSFSAALNWSAQKAALMMDANNTLDHHPSSNWRCWSAAGATAASRSNLALAYPSLGSGQIIDLYMSDDGSSNVAVGHRRWILNPFSTVMGSGSTDKANALTVVGPTSASRPNPRYVSWPTPGYFPNALEPHGRWSLSAGLNSVSFARARIAVYDGTRLIPVHKFAVENGYAQPTLVWQMPAGISLTHAYKVVVTHIRRAGIRRNLSHTYTVRLFTPSQ
ncbi:MAG: hypothetical protein JWQ32_2782 [Marmoricola sp.]|nr:hypothetical protein [Marmoricola sp.]